MLNPDGFINTVKDTVFEPDLERRESFGEVDWGHGSIPGGGTVQQRQEVGKPRACYGRSRGANVVGSRGRLQGGSSLGSELQKS